MKNRLFTCVAAIASVAIVCALATAKDKKAPTAAKDKKAPAVAKGKTTATAAKGKKPVKVFLLVGQSNMQGKGSVKHLAELVKSQPKKYGHLMKDGKWVLRDDVWGSFHARPGQRLGVG
ncbi:MAG: sialate O-acetylesterase, partial [bacterium]|nr:sialate O-acetylesterase [bacterium]